MTGPRRRPFLHASLALLASCSSGERAPPETGAARSHRGEADLTADVPVPMSTKIGRLIASYPDHLACVEGDALLWRDGSRMPIGAEQPARPFQEMLRSATIADQLRQAYEQGPTFGPPPHDHSPGRLRHTSFFMKMYGDCHAGPAGAPRLRSVTWMPRTKPQTLLVTSVNDVAGRLERVVAMLEGMPDRVKAHLVPSAGAYNCRVVADSGLPSMHAFGAAIDLESATPSTGSGRVRAERLRSWPSAR